MIIRHLIVKEFKQIFRNILFPVIFVILPFVLVNGVPRVATQEVKGLKMTVIDNDHSSTSRKIIHKINASKYVDLSVVSPNYARAMESVHSELADIIVEFPQNFERDIVNDSNPEIMLSANATNGTKGIMAQNYITQIIADYFSNRKIDTSAKPRFLYNISLDYKLYMVPAMMGLFLILIVGFLPALNIVSEKEKGTIEQINVTPINKWEFIVSKIVPYIAIGMFMVLEGIMVARGALGFFPRGFVPLIFLLSVIFCLLVSSFGLVVSNYSNTMQQAALTMFFFLVIFILMSGLITPIQSMPRWSQVLTYFNPLRYFIEANRAIYIKGSSFSQLSTQFLALLSYAAILWTWAILSYKKNS